MKILDTGDLGVAASEKITVKVTKSMDPYVAPFSDLIGSAWATTTRPNNLTEVRTFQAPAAPGSEASFTLVFDFAPDQEGGFDPADKYVVEITGDPAGQARTSTIVPPPISSRGFTFVVEDPS
jgi:hypothetical protein